MESDPGRKKHQTPESRSFRFQLHVAQTWILFNLTGWNYPNFNILTEIKSVLVDTRGSRNDCLDIMIIHNFTYNRWNVASSEIWNMCFILFGTSQLDILVSQNWCWWYWVWVMDPTTSNISYILWILFPTFRFKRSVSVILKGLVHVLGSKDVLIWHYLSHL